MRKRTDEGDLLPGADREAQVLDGGRVGARGVREGHVLELNKPCHALAGGQGDALLGHGVHGALTVQQREHGARRALRLVHGGAPVDGCNHNGGRETWAHSSRGSRRALLQDASLQQRIRPHETKLPAAPHLFSLTKPKPAATRVRVCSHRCRPLVLTS